MRRYNFPEMTKQLGSFSLSVQPGEFTDSEIIVMLGENGTGKTTFIRLMAGLLKPDSGGVHVCMCCVPSVTTSPTDQVPQMSVSYKPQKISPKFPGTVRQLLHTKIRDAYVHPQFITDVMKPLLIEAVFDQEVLNLSGGELQRVALTICLGQVLLFLSQLTSYAAAFHYNCVY